MRRKAAEEAWAKQHAKPIRVVKGGMPVRNRRQH
jgi:hypothetical protein